MAQRKVATKKPAANNKRGPKAKQVEEKKPEKEVEASDDSDAEEEENGINFDDGSNSEAEAAAGLVDSEAEEDDEEDDDEDDDEEDDEVEPGEVANAKKAAADSDNDDDDDSDEEPTEAPIGKPTKPAEKDTPKKTGIPKVTVGRIPLETPKDQLLFVTHLPAEYKHYDLVAVFTKFGPIAVLNRIKTKLGGNSVLIAFESAEAVDAALAAKEKALTINGQVVAVSRPHRKEELNVRTVVVGLIGPNATKEQIMEHFEGCGKVESVNFSHNRNLPSAFVRFESVSSVAKALKLHGSEFQSRFITVREESYKSKQVKSPKLTLTLFNTGNHESYKADILEKAFKKHGEIVDIDIVCTRSILCFVTYKTEEQAEKALKQMQGKTIGDLEIKLENYHFSTSARSILVSNLAAGVDEKELTEVFNQAGEIDTIKMLSNKALIKFVSDDGFCKSFLLNEQLVQGQPIFLEPNSLLKHKMMSKKSGPHTHKLQGKPTGAPGRFFNKFENKNFNNNNQKKPFNKRPSQENGSAQKSFKRAKNT